MHHLFRPFERFRFLVAGLGEGVYGVAYVPDGTCVQPTEGLPPQDTEPTFYLVKPGGMRGGVVEMNIGMARNPQV